MAPRNPPPKVEGRVKQAGDRVEKSKPRVGPVRRFDNGLLDVTRKSGKHTKAIKHNSLTPLLRLQPEIRNQIWEYSLGGYTLGVSCQQTTKRGEIARPWNSPTYAFALLRVCRQTHAETALLPFKANVFCFHTYKAFDWARSLHKVQRKLISQIQIATRPRHFKRSSKQVYCPDLFPGLKEVVLKIGWFRKPHPSKKQVKRRVQHVLGKLSERNPGVRVVAQRLSF